MTNLSLLPAANARDRYCRCRSLSLRHLFLSSARPPPHTPAAAASARPRSRPSARVRSSSSPPVTSAGHSSSPAGAAERASLAAAGVSTTAAAVSVKYHPVSVSRYRYGNSGKYIGLTEATGPPRAHPTSFASPPDPVAPERTRARSLRPPEPGGSSERMLRCVYTQRRWAHRRGGFVTGGTGWSKPPPPGLGPAAGVGTKKSEWWAVDGEMHELGDGVPHRERFAIPRDNLPNRRRKQMREQFMRRTRLVLKDSEHEAWCKKYMELYQELREDWERLYWDEGYSKKMAESHANYDSAEEDDLDFSPYSRRRQSNVEPNKGLGFGVNKQNETWERVTQIRDKFEYDRERRMRERAFAPMNMENNFARRDPRFRSQDDSSFAHTDLSDDFGLCGQTFGSRPDRSYQNESNFRNQRDSSIQNELSVRNQRNLNFQNKPSFRSHRYPDFQNQGDTRSQAFDE